MKYAAFDRATRRFLSVKSARPTCGSVEHDKAGGVLVGDSADLVIAALKRIFGDDDWFRNRFVAVPAPPELDNDTQVDAAVVIEHRVLH